MKELRRFVVREDHDFGVTGFVPEGAPSHFNSASEGGIIAHDAIEHIKGDTSWTGELIALGQMVYIRAGGNYWSNFKQNYTTDPFKHLASDLLAFFPAEGWFTPDPGRTTAVDEEAEQCMADAFAELRRMVPLEFEPDDRPTSATLERCIANARGWMRKGYRTALRRFHGASSWSVCNLFANIEHACDRYTRTPEFYEVLEVRYDTKTLEFSVSLKEIDYDD